MPSPPDKHTRIILIGSIPPPIGGVSSHVLRLAEALRAHGRECLVFDLYPEAGKVPFGSWHRISPFRSRPLALVWARLSLRAGDLVHLHLSRAAGAAVALPVLQPGRRGRLILTLHDGDQDYIISRSSRLVRWLAERCLPRLDRIVALSSKQEAFYRRLGAPPERIVRWLGAPPSVSQPDDAALPAALRDLKPASRGGDQIVLVSSGYLAPTYRFELTLALHRALSQSRRSVLVLCFYGDEEDMDYAARILNEAAATPGVIVVRALSPAAFLALLSRADLYLRPSFVDSYGLAISEALDVGARALASDVCTRDPRCELFDTDNPEAFLQKGLAMAEGRLDASPPSPVAAVGADFVLETYRFAPET